ncbi:MAG: molecular chaperone DnaJ [Roseiflexus castenholzii]|uniref:tetratricopeptide repeat protein n=1 Tax=Roseiflexus castenholzii TaxID=120962 RepID=UPI000CBD876E|nr:MAG: molecular chaperone DnaJ [Roseiflexus castenholzii]
MATQDFYDILQVAPDADKEAICAAYQRLREQYDPQKLNGAAAELVELAQQRLSRIDEAYATLSDAQRRAQYDAQRQASLQDVPDYRPLPPAQHAERPRDFNPRPTINQPAAIAGPAAAVIAVLAIALVSIIGGLILTGGGGVPQAVPTPTTSPMDALETMIARARQIAEQNENDAQVWLDYANLLYDSVQIVREQAPNSVLYQQRLPRWLEAAKAYERVLELDPTNAVARGDLGASRCFYGAGVGDQTFVVEGLKDLETATTARPEDTRLLLNLGLCLASAQPPRTDEAIEVWQRIISIAPTGSPVANEAQRLIDQVRR